MTKFEWVEHSSFAIDGSHSYSYFHLMYGDKKCGQYLLEYEGWPERKKVYRIGLHDKPSFDENAIKLEVINQHRKKLDNEDVALVRLMFNA